ncbi:MAG: AmmeMemoRadiSam system radical SAM enzyme [Ignavibacteria bacterium]|nr:AmmeMemoRadiSam system radical SAM enzyme [Ignavibacteria bacterium]
MQEASYYNKLDEVGRVKCLLCPKECVIVDGKTGTCGVRKNIGGKLISLVYGRPIAIHIDPIEKKPLYHFYPGSKIFSIGTFGCNLSCRFCQNYDISQFDPTEDLETLEEIRYFTPAEVVKMCKHYELEFLAFTYNEPTIFYEYMMDIAKLCKNPEDGHEIKTVVVSNGQINEAPLRNLLPYIDAFNIDLKAFNENFYKRICNGNLETTKNTIKIIVEEKKHIEVTFLLIENFNDNKQEFLEMCKFLKSLDENIVLHISRAFPHYKLYFKPTPYKLMKDFYDIAKLQLKNVYLGNV